MKSLLRYIPDFDRWRVTQGRLFEMGMRNILVNRFCHWRLEHAVSRRVCLCEVDHGLLEPTTCSFDFILQSHAKISQRAQCNYLACKVIPFIQYSFSSVQIQVKLDSAHEAASAYVEAAKCYQKTNKAGENLLLAWHFFDASIQQHTEEIERQTWTNEFPDGSKFVLELYVVKLIHKIAFPQMCCEHCTELWNISLLWGVSAWQPKISGYGLE